MCSLPRHRGQVESRTLAPIPEALRTGDLVAPRDSGLRLNELYPQRYARAAERVAADHYTADATRYR